jgi:alpha-galactosidase
MQKKIMTPFICGLHSTARYAFLCLVACILHSHTGLAQETTYEAESGILSNGAQLSGCSSCSGGQLVGYLGGNTNGAVTLTVHAAVTGKYTLKVYYASGDPRSINVTVNNNTVTGVNCVPSGDWSKVAVTAIVVELTAGSNTLKLDNATGWAPNIDKLGLLPYTATHFVFGSHRIEYDTDGGIFTVYYNNLPVISNAYAMAYNGSTSLSSAAYSSRTITQAAFSDSFGSGTRYTVTLTGNSLPQMKQVFYVYPGKSHFFTEISISGSNLSSNYMAPLIANSANLQAAGDVRDLFVPFDNDAFVRYDARSLASQLTNTSAEVGAVYENNSRKGLVTGSVEHDTWKTGVRTTGIGASLSELTVWGGYTDGGVTRDQKAHGAISGSTLKSPKVFAGYYDDWRQGLEDYAKANRYATPKYVFNWTSPVPFGWNSWGEIKSNLTLSKATAVADFFAGQLPAFRSGNTAYIDLDSYWDNLTPGGMTGDFSQLTQFVNYCNSKGLKAGIYWAPFVDWGKYERPIENSSYNYQDVWLKENGNYHDMDGCRAMDPTHPGTQQRIAYLIGKFKACGFKMIKIDFLGHAAMEADSYYDPTVKTGMQAFKKGMQYLVDQLAGQMLVYAAISPNLATAPYVHMRRIACDAESDIGASQYTLNSTNYGWWQTYVYNYIDADHMVFREETEGTNRARFASGIVTGTLITGDDFSAPPASLTDRAKRILQNQAILNIARNSNGKAFRPVDGNTGNQTNELFVKQVGNFYYLAVFNFSSAAKNYTIPLSRIGLPGHFQATELYSNTTVDADQSLNISLPAADAAIYRFTMGSAFQQCAPCLDKQWAKAGAQNNVFLYPNPTSHYVNIRSARPISCMRLLDISGNVLQVQNNINSTTYQLNMGTYPSSMYVVELKDPSGVLTSCKIIKNK